MRDCTTGNTDNCVVLSAPLTSPLVSVTRSGAMREGCDRRIAVGPNSRRLLLSVLVLLYLVILPPAIPAAVSHKLATPAAGRVGAGQAHGSAHAAEMAFEYPSSDPFSRAFYACVWTADLRYRLNGVPAPPTSERSRMRPQRRAWIPWEYYDDAGDCGGN
jgi:hypothetical protein